MNVYPAVTFLYKRIIFSLYSRSVNKYPPCSLHGTGVPNKIDYYNTVSVSWTSHTVLQKKWNHKNQRSIGLMVILVVSFLFTDNNKRRNENQRVKWYTALCARGRGDDPPPLTIWPYVQYVDMRGTPKIPLCRMACALCTSKGQYIQ